MNRRGLIEKVQEQTVIVLNGYLELPEDMSSLICKSSFGNDAGLTGALVLAESAIQENMLDDEPRTNGNDQNAFAVGFVHGLGVGLGAALCLGMLVSNQRKG